MHKGARQPDGMPETIFLECLALPRPVIRSWMLETVPWPLPFFWSPFESRTNTAKPAPNAANVHFSGRNSVKLLVSPWLSGDGQKQYRPVNFCPPWFRPEHHDGPR